MRRLGLLVLTLAIGCGDADDPGSSGPLDDTSSSSTSASTTSAPADPPSGSTIASTTDAEGSSSTTTAQTAGTSAATSTGSDASTGCSAGTPGCSCDAGSCAAGLACLEEVCTAPEACEQDLLEPNDEETAPTLLGEIEDDDDKGGSIFGTLDGPDDVDWYRYTGNDTLLGDVDPARFVKSDGGVRLCKFAECDGGPALTEFDCPAETEAATSPQGRPGCCAPMGVVLDDANCTDGLDDDMQVFLRVDQAGAECVAYELVYHF